MFFLKTLSVVVIAFNLSAYEDLSSIYEEGISAWLDGRIDDAIGSFEYIVHNSTDQVLTLSAGDDLIVLLNEKGEHTLALAYADKLLAIDENNVSILFEKAYSYILLNDFIKAKEILDNISSITSDPDRIYFARFLKALVESYLSGYDKAIKEMEAVYKFYPPLLPASSYLLSQYIKPFKKMASINFLKDALTYEPRNIQALIDLAQIYEETKYYTQSWQAYFTLREMEGIDSYADKKAKKLIKKINKPEDELFFWSRLGWPLHQQPLKTQGMTPIRIALYSDSQGYQPYLISFYLISNSDFEIVDVGFPRRFQAKKNMQYQLFYNTSNRQIEIRDNYSNVLYTTRRSIQIKSQTPGSVFLIKSPKFNDKITGINRGDREVSGWLDISFSTQGMKMINHSYLEHILPSIVQNIEGPKSEEDSLKAIVITARTMLFKKLNPSKDYDITDKEEYLEFKGLQFEKEKILKAVSETQDLILKKDGQIYSAGYSINTANIVNSKPDSLSTFPKRLTPSSLKNWLLFDIIKNPLYSTPQDPLELSNISWWIILKPYWIEERINSRYKVGKIKDIIVLKRDHIGQVTSIKIEGTANNLIIEGEREVNRYLAAGSLRSNLFIVKKIKKRRFPEFFIIKGAGTGRFTGLCIYGADYLAKNMGFNYIQILRYYFPDATVAKR